MMNKEIKIPISFLRISDPSRSEIAIYEQCSKLNGSIWEHGFLRYDEAEVDEWGHPPIKKVSEIQNCDGSVYVPSNIKLIENRFLVIPGEWKEYNDETFLFQEIESFYRRWVLIDEEYYPAIASYTMLTYVYDLFSTVAYLRVLGDFGTGKSRLLEVMSSICYKSMKFGGSLTPATIFRLIDKIRGTLFLDEADFQNPDINQILCTGYRKDNPIIRCNPKDFEPEAFYSYGPKVIATRHKFEDPALESRCLTLQMYRRDLPDNIPRILTENFSNEAENIRNKLILYRLRKISSGINVRNHSIAGLSNRENELLIPMVSVFPDIEQHLVTLLLHQHNQERLEIVLSQEAILVRAIRDSASISDTLRTMTELATRANDISQREGHEVRFTPKKVGKILRELNLNTSRGRNGYYLPLASNQERLNQLYEDFLP